MSIETTKHSSAVSGVNVRFLVPVSGEEVAFEWIYRERSRW